MDTMKERDARLLLKTPIFDVEEVVDRHGIGFNPVAVRSNDWVTAIVEKDGLLLSVEQLRYGLMARYVEFPCGIVESGEVPRQAAARELAEETGCTVRPESLAYLGCFAANPAFMTNHMHYFYIKLRGEDEGSAWSMREPSPDPGERLEVSWVSPRDMFRRTICGCGSSLMAGALLLLLEKGVFDASTFKFSCCER